MAKATHIMPFLEFEPIEYVMISVNTAARINEMAKILGKIIDMTNLRTCDHGNSTK